MNNCSKQFITSHFMVLIACVALFSGCDSSTQTGDVLPTVSAKGVLTNQGQPLEFYQVMFFPDGGRPAMGVTGADGSFTLGTNGSDDGAMVGKHHVAVKYVGPPNTNPGAGVTDFTPPPPPKIKINKKYEDPATSQLNVEIPQSGNTDIRIDLK